MAAHTYMSYTSQIDVRELGKKGVLDEDRFYRLLSEQNNYVDHKTVKDFYMGLVRVITKDLRDNGVCRLPHLGDMALVKQKDKIGWAGKFQKIIKGSYLLKFYPKSVWKQYFVELSKKDGLDGRLDPREKILGREL